MLYVSCACFAHRMIIIIVLLFDRLRFDEFVAGQRRVCVCVYFACSSLLINILLALSPKMVQSCRRSSTASYLETYAN